MRKQSFRRSGPVAIMLAGVLSIPGAPCRAKEFTIATPMGPIQVDVPHLTTEGARVSPEAATVSAFRPPAIFSAPLPSGSGARALGLAGAFTAVADDATAASWNPGGLIQLERPEGSFVLRASAERHTHHAESETMRVGRDRFDSYGLNYLSGVLPFKLRGRNAVFSINYQEAYDFTQQFSADFTNRSSRFVAETAEARQSSTFTDRFVYPEGEIVLTSRIATETFRRLDQTLTSDLLTALDFDQQGVIDAVTPALAVELTPRLSAGAALNFYRDDLLGLHPIRTRTRANFSGFTDSAVNITEQRTTSGTWSYEGTMHFPSAGNLPGFDVPIPGRSGEYEPFSDTETSREGGRLAFDGTLVEENRIDELSGCNATFGALWTVSRLLGLGFTVDLPWLAEARQRRTVEETITTYDRARTRVLEVSEKHRVETRDVEFRFPLYWAVAAVLRLTDAFYLTADVSQTRWSQFYFKSEGEGRINPLDGSPYDQNKLDDTWAVRSGMEYVLFLSKTEVPLRAGVAWEQRPAIGSPDEFWHFTLGAGVSVGKKPHRAILDVAYVFSHGENALGSLIPGAGMTSDVEEHQVYVSGILHF